MSRKLLKYFYKTLLTLKTKPHISN